MLTQKRIRRESSNKLQVHKFNGHFPLRELKLCKALRGHPYRKAVIKYAALTVIGILLYLLAADSAYAQRGYKAVGGEIMALFLPFWYYAISRTVGDFLRDWRE